MEKDKVKMLAELLAAAIMRLAGMQVAAIAK